MSKQDEFGGRGRDEFMFEYVVSKANDRKIFQHKSFEEIVARYWQLMRQIPGFNQTKDTIDFDQYAQLMKRIFKVLLPLYREKEVTREVSKLWVIDAAGMKEMTLITFQKMLFKISHHWTVHIDIEEYVEFLTKLYERIIVKKIIRGSDGSSVILLPEICTEITQDDGIGEGAEDEWQSCFSNEEQYSHFEYKHEEDAEQEAVKMYKRKKAAGSDDGEDDTQTAPVFSSREPFMFKEQVKFFRDEFSSNQVDSEEEEDDEERRLEKQRIAERPQPLSGDTVIDIMADFTDILPLGYPTEQFFAKTKNEVTAAYKKIREEKKKALDAMKREILEGVTTLGAEKRQAPNDKDPGLLEQLGIIHDLEFPVFCSTHKIRVRCYAKCKDVAYNALRNLLKEFSAFMLRPVFEYPRNAAAKQKAPKLLSSKEPDTLVNTFGYNPALERRVNYKNLEIIVPGMSGKQKRIINVNYLIEDPVYDTAFRSDVTRVETNNKLANKVPDDYLKEEEFVNVTTTFSEVITLMLMKKFETFFTNRLQEQDPMMQERSEKINANEAQRKAFAQMVEPLTQKGLTETFDEKPFMKLMKGPFYDLMSREGIPEDDFVTCGVQDLIDSANQEAQRILIIGKPRAGRTTLTKSLCEQLDLVQVSPDLWIEDILYRIKNRDEELNEEETDNEAMEIAKSKVEPELDEDGNPKPEQKEPEEPEKIMRKKEWRTPLEVKITEKVFAGQVLSDEDIDEIMIEMINSPHARTKGFVLDIDFSTTAEKTWVQRITRAEMLPANEEFTHIIELLIDDEEVQERASGMLYSLEPKPAEQDEGDFHPDHGKVFSAWERKQRIKPPKAVIYDEETGEIVEDEEEEEEDDNAPKPFDETTMFVRACEDKDRFLQELDYYVNIERPAVDDFIVNCYDHTYIKLDVAGMTPKEVCETVKFRLKPFESAPLRPVGKIIEESNDYKQLLTEGIEEVEIGTEDAPKAFMPLPRQWSLWKQIDPVSLSRGSVDKGEAGFAAEYANNAFAFVDEKNRDAFAKSPKDYLKAAPQMPKDYRVLVVGPSCSGVKTQAEKLSEFYGWKVVDYPKIVADKLAEINEMPEKPPNNISEEGPCMICLSQKELDDIRDHKPFPAHKFMPWILEYMGVPLTIKPPPPPTPEPNFDELTEQEIAAYKKEQLEKHKAEEKKIKEELEKEAAKKERAARRQNAIEEGLELEGSLAESVEEIIIDDLEIDKLVPELGPKGKLHVEGGFIMTGFPNTEAQIEKLKEAGIEFDRVIYLTDQSEEDAGKIFVDRHNANDKTDTAYEWELESERVTKIMAQVKELIGEEKLEVVLKEVDAGGEEEKVFIKIRTAMDPFFISVDNPDDCRTTADVMDNFPPADPEDFDKDAIYDRKLPRSDFGPYCPITYVRDGYMFKGNPEIESTLRGKTYVFAGEAEQEEFKFNPEKYLVVQKGLQTLPLTPSMPKIMISGLKGSGVTTQIRMICDKFKLEELELHTQFLKKLNEEKEKRKRSRKLNLGFRPPPEEQEEGEEWKDEEVENDPWEQEERETHEKAMLKEVIQADKGYIIDGNWTTIPEDAVSAPFQELLLDSRRMPEIFVILRCKPETTFKRCMDEAVTKGKFDEIEKKIKKEIEDETIAARKERQDELDKQKEEEQAQEEPPAEEDALNVEADMKTWNDERKETDEAAFEDHADKPILEDMIAAEKEVLQEQITKDEDFLTDFIEFLKEKNVEVVDTINTDISPEYVFIKLLDKIQKRIENRHDLIEREQAEPLSLVEVPFYEKSYKYKVSKFGVNSPINPFNPCKTKDFAVLYRERIYFLADEDEQEKFLLEPFQCVKQGEAIPNDISIRPQISVLGLPKSGKSELCQKIQDQTRAIHLNMEQILENEIRRDSMYAQSLRGQTMHQGQSFDDEHLVKLLHRRIQEKDCKENGWVLENFPQTREQALLMAQRSILPNNVFVVQIDPTVCYQRAKGDNSFGYINDILKIRIEATLHNLPQVAFFFQKFYNSVKNIDGCRSRWFVQHTALEALEKTLKARMQFVRNYSLNQSEVVPCVMENMNIDRVLMKQSISQYSYLCPVTWKMKKTFFNCCHQPEFCVLYRNLFYYFASAAQRDTFIKNPSKFSDKVIFTNQRNTPVIIRNYKAAELVAQEKALQNHCPVTLKDESKVAKGNPLLVVQYKDNRYVFVDEEKLVRFFTEPSVYADTQLPVKMPPNMDPVQLVKLQSQEDSITFLEQALGSIVTRGLREVGENRLKYPTLTVKETMLKLFAIFLKAENPANTSYMKEKYHKKMQAFIERCEVPMELNKLAEDKKKSEGKKKGKNWPQFKEDYYNSLGAKYDDILKTTEKERKENFQNYIK